MVKPMRKRRQNRLKQGMLGNLCSQCLKNIFFQVVDKELSGESDEEIADFLQRVFPNSIREGLDEKLRVKELEEIWDCYCPISPEMRKIYEQETEFSRLPFKCSVIVSVEKEKQKECERKEKALMQKCKECKLRCSTPIRGKAENKNVFKCPREGQLNLASPQLRLDELQSNTVEPQYEIVWFAIKPKEIKGIQTILAR